MTFYGIFLSVWIGNHDHLHLITYPKERTKSGKIGRYYIGYTPPLFKRFKFKYENYSTTAKKEHDPGLY
jgi:hypothetical protein